MAYSILVNRSPPIQIVIIQVFHSSGIWAVPSAGLEYILFRLRMEHDFVTVVWSFIINSSIYFLILMGSQLNYVGRNLKVHNCHYQVTKGYISLEIYNIKF